MATTALNLNMSGCVVDDMMQSIIVEATILFILSFNSIITNSRCSRVSNGNRKQFYFRSEFLWVLKLENNFYPENHGSGVENYCYQFRVCTHI
jgi:hypothetical protein